MSWVVHDINFRLCRTIYMLLVYGAYKRRSCCRYRRQSTGAGKDTERELLAGLSINEMLRFSTAKA